MHSGKETHVNVTVVFGPDGVSRKDPPVVKYSTVSNTDAPVAIGAAGDRAPITDSLRPLAAALLLGTLAFVFSMVMLAVLTGADVGLSSMPASFKWKDNLSWLWVLLLTFVFGGSGAGGIYLFRKYMTEGKVQSVGMWVAGLMAFLFAFLGLISIVVLATPGIELLAASSVPSPPPRFLQHRREWCTRARSHSPPWWREPWLTSTRPHTRTTWHRC